jgi:hypothetical protein
MSQPSGPAARVVAIAVDTDTAYGRKARRHEPTLTEVGAGTPMGELLRRYWHPIGLAADAGDTPRKVRVLGEDLILFRDKSGRAGLVEPHCAHRKPVLPLRAADRRRALSDLHRGPRSSGRRSRQRALAPERQALGRAERSRAPAAAGQLRGAAEPGRDRVARRRAPRHVRSRHRNAAAAASTPAG